MNNLLAQMKSLADSQRKSDFYIAAALSNPYKKKYLKVKKIKTITILFVK
jgi:hypothetical protein